MPCQLGALSAALDMMGVYSVALRGAESMARAFSSQVDTLGDSENATKQKLHARQA
jgi:hypothetical protein